MKKRGICVDQVLSLYMPVIIVAETNTRGNGVVIPSATAAYYVSNITSSERYQQCDRSSLHKDEFFRGRNALNSTKIRESGTHGVISQSSFSITRLVESSCSFEIKAQCKSYLILLFYATASHHQ
jgi:hypothetical protein